MSFQALFQVFFQTFFQALFQTFFQAYVPVFCSPYEPVLRQLVPEPVLRPVFAERVRPDVQRCAVQHDGAADFAAAPGDVVPVPEPQSGFRLQPVADQRYWACSGVLQPGLVLTCNGAPEPVRLWPH